ncbi:MAG TPA: FkbM family methyltransferase [Sphingobacteriaceae bacterium]|nr:FkbM family methyltransferase [Sphingobacteriaceae bacterium]
MLKRAFKSNSHNGIFKAMAGFGRSMNRLYENRNHDSKSNGEVTILKKLAHFNPQVIIDGGANHGEYSLLVNGIMKDCVVYSFEPVINTYEKLKLNLNGINNVFPINQGLYHENCSADINIFNSDEHSSMYSFENLSQKPVNVMKADFIKGDTFLEEKKINRVDLLKLDLEGAEFDALKGFDTSLKNNKIKCIQFEYGYINIKTKKLLIDYYELLTSYGYIIGKVYPKRVEFRDYNFKHEDFLGPNYLAVNATEKELIQALEN